MHHDRKMRGEGAKTREICRTNAMVVKAVKVVYHVCTPLAARKKLEKA
jgi:hypothetical protein